MKITIKLTIVTLLMSSGLDNTQAQMATGNYAEVETDSFKACNGFQYPELKSMPDSSGSSVIQGGIGFGYMMKGGFLGMKFKFA